MANNPCNPTTTFNSERQDLIDDLAYLVVQQNRRKQYLAKDIERRTGGGADDAELDSLLKPTKT